MEFNYDLYVKGSNGKSRLHASTDVLVERWKLNAKEFSKEMLEIKNTEVEM